MMSMSQPAVSLNNKIATIVFALFASFGCTENQEDSVSSPIALAPEPEYKGQQDLSMWMINPDEQGSKYILNSSSTEKVPVNVLSVSSKEIDGKGYVEVRSQGIPKYDIIITDEIMQSLTSRPKAATDFVAGMPKIKAGDVVKFGQDIGYRSNRRCTEGFGYGYWPPGPDCPTEDERVVVLPTAPTPSDQACDNGLGKVGIFVNGTSVYNWQDGQSYKRQGQWSHLAPIAELYDVDICGGHAARGDYHHHFYTSCLADLVGDQGQGHSPLYGYAADGYPIYGPWENKGLLATSSWVLRDYNDDTLGCADGLRSCVLKDPYDLALGTEAAKAGPGFDEVVTSLSGNQFIAENGFYFEDHYWDKTLTAQGGAYLDQYNGHYDKTRGYHYHITVTQDSKGKLTPAFPYIIGPRYAGKLAKSAIARCSTGLAPGPPPGRRPPGPPPSS